MAEHVATGHVVAWQQVMQMCSTMWAAHKEKGVLGDGSQRYIPSWTEIELRKMRKSPSACQAAKFDTAGLRGLGRWSGEQEGVQRSTLGRSHLLRECSVWGSHKGPNCWAEEGLRKCHPPALFPVERALSNPHPSSTLPTVGKSFKLLSFFWVSAGPMECSCPPQVAGFSASQSAPTLSSVQPH